MSTTTPARTMAAGLWVALLASACGVPEFDVWVTDGSPPQIHWDEHAMNSLNVIECDQEGCQEGSCRSGGVIVWSVEVGWDGKGYFSSPLAYGVPPAGSAAWPESPPFSRGGKALPLKATAHYAVEVALLAQEDSVSWQSLARGSTCISGIDHAVDTTADCGGDEQCRRFGKCTSQRYRCVVGSDADCRQSSGCKYYGRCKRDPSPPTADCVSGSDADCKQSVNCKSAGWCTKIKSGCGAGSDVDCQQSDHCAATGHCKAKDGLCV